MVELIEFHAPWCGPCDQQEPIVDEIVEEREDVHLNKVNVDEDNETASEYSVRSVPTIVILDEEGNPAERFVGLTQRDDIVEAIDNA